MNKYSIRTIKKPTAKVYDGHVLLEDMYIERVYDVIDFNFIHNPMYIPINEHEVYDEMIYQLSKSLLEHVQFETHKVADVLGKYDQYRVSLSFLSDEDRELYKKTLEKNKSLETETEFLSDRLLGVESERDILQEEVSLQNSTLSLLHSRYYSSLIINIILIGLLIILIFS